MKNWQRENKVELTDKDHLELAIKNIAKEYGFVPVKLNDINKLKEGDIAVVLIKGKTLKGEWHWMCFPYHDVETIKKWYGKNTVVKDVYLLKWAN